jgi:ubiquinone/menaquinone biosynthesis C-methylase UbiE
MDAQMDNRTDEAKQIRPDELKACCAAVYSSDLARQLLGESFHPGGLALTERLGKLLDLGPGKHVLDVAAGRGSSATFLAQRFGCEVLGVEYGSDSVLEATRAAEASGIAHLVGFEQGDAECLTSGDEQFDAVICECAFCTFPNKHAAAGELARVLRPGGKVGLTDLTRSGEVPPAFQGLLAWIACIADAQHIDEYAHYLEHAGLTVDRIEPHDAALSAMVHDIRTKLFAAELLVKLKQINLPSVDFEQVRSLARAAADAIKARRFGYALFIATKHC